MKDTENGIDSFAATVFKTFRGLFDSVRNFTGTFRDLGSAIKPVFDLFAAPVFFVFEGLLIRISNVINRIVLAFNE